jgi:hypothetical protein
MATGSESLDYSDRETLSKPDPTKNVLDLVNASILRLNDVIAANDKRQDDLRAALIVALDTRDLAEAKRLNDAMEIERARVNEAFKQLRDYVDALRITDQAALAAALAATERAIAKNDAAYEKRFDGVNGTIAEFRDVLRDQAAATLPRTEYAIAQTSIENQIKTFSKTYEDAIANLRTNLEARVEANAQGVANLAARAAGGSENFTRLFTVGMFIVTMGSLIYAIFVHH